MSNKEAQVNWNDDGRDYREYRHCNVCGETWIDTGDPICLFCGEPYTEPVEEEQEEQCNPEA